MAKKATDVRGAFLPALGAGAALSAMLFASRLPVSLDFILPRRAGWSLFVLAHGLLSRPGARQGIIWVVSLLLAGSLARFVWLIGASVRDRGWTLADFLKRGFMAAVVVLLLRWSFTIWFEVSQKVWFPFGSLNAMEPLANLLVGFLLVFCAMSATLAQLSPRPPSAVRSLLPWAAANALAALMAISLYGAWSSAEPSREGRRLFVVLTEEEGRPSQAAYDLPMPPDDAPDAAEQKLAKAGVRRLELLRALYEARSKFMDPAGLRRALMLGVKYGDGLARSLLLEHLSAAPPSPEAVGALGALADESSHRIGPMGASRIARAYARLGDEAQAGIWAKRASEGPRGIPAGLLDLSGGGSLRPGRISGRIDGLKPRKIALYRKADPGSPYLLDAAGLAASAEPDAAGRFSFSGLAAGRYYLAFAFSSDERTRGELRVFGHRGDLSLDVRRASLDLPALTIKPQSAGGRE